jgi:hypothetical protein
MLIINNCSNITNIPIIEGLQKLCIMDCPKIINIPNIKGLQVLHISNMKDCSNITNIPIIEGLQSLKINYCKNYYNYDCIYNNLFQKRNYNIKEFNNINKIKRWYKRVKLSKKLRLCAELVIIDEMNPHKENNQYLERYIKEKVYEN